MKVSYFCTVAFLFSMMAHSEPRKIPLYDIPDEIVSKDLSFELNQPKISFEVVRTEKQFSFRIGPNWQSLKMESCNHDQINSFLRRYYRKKKDWKTKATKPNQKTFSYLEQGQPQKVGPSSPLAKFLRDTPRQLKVLYSAVTIACNRGTNK